MSISEREPQLLLPVRTVTPTDSVALLPPQAVGPDAGDAVAAVTPTCTVFVLSRLDPPRHVHVSDGFEALTGCPGADLLGDSTVLVRLIHPDDLQVAAAWGQQFWAARPGHVELRIVRPDGEVRWIRMASALMPVDDGDGVGMITAIDDITRRVADVEAARSAEQAARAAHSAKTALISRVGHDLRTPLNAVIGFAQLLERRMTDPDDLSSVQYILSSGRHLLAMIEDVLDITRIGAGNLPLTVEPVEAASLVDEVVQLVQPAADRAGVAIAVDGGMPELRLLGDRLRLVQVLRDVVGRAVAEQAPGGHVRISWSAAGGASVTVRTDAGGDEARDLSDGPTSAAAVGSMARALVELMSGTVTVGSGSGGGFSVTVRLPAAADRRAAVGAVEVASVPVGGSPAPAAGVGPTTLLYIEDGAPNVRVVTSLLRLRPGWRLVHAGLGSTGVEIARSRTPDLILLDLHLPDCFGLSVLETLKADPRTADIPVVVLSGDARLTQVDRLLQAGAAQYLTKPLDVREVLMLLDGITADQLARTVDA